MLHQTRSFPRDSAIMSPGHSHLFEPTQYGTSRSTNHRLMQTLHLPRNTFLQHNLYWPENSSVQRVFRLTQVRLLEKREGIGQYIPQTAFMIQTTIRNGCRRQKLLTSIHIFIGFFHSLSFTFFMYVCILIDYLFTFPAKLYTNLYNLCRRSYSTVCHLEYKCSSTDSMQNNTAHGHMT